MLIPQLRELGVQLLAVLLEDLHRHLSPAKHFAVAAQIPVGSNSARHTFISESLLQRTEDAGGLELDEPAVLEVVRAPETCRCDRYVLSTAEIAPTIQQVIRR